MILNIKYFGMIAEKINCSEEEFEMIFDQNLDLKSYFENRYPILKTMDYKIAVNQEFSNNIENDRENVEIALLPPFAGG